MGAIVAALSATSQAQVLINFDDGQANGNSIGTFYSSLGVTFTNAKWRNSVGAPGTSGTQSCSSLAMATSLNHRIHSLQTLDSLSHL